MAPLLHHLGTPGLIACAFAAALLLALAQRLRVTRALTSLAFTTALLAVLLVTLRERAPFDPSLDRIAGRLGIGDAQQVVGGETRIPIARDGHYWAQVSVNGARRRMLVDSGATVTALSPDIAARAGLHLDRFAPPVLLRTANGAVTARTGRVRELRVGSIVARDLAVVVSPSFGGMDVIGMNFLSRLRSWRVADGTLILTPHRPQGGAVRAETG